MDLPPPPIFYQNILNFQLLWFSRNLTHLLFLTEKDFWSKKNLKAEKKSKSFLKGNPKNIEKCSSNMLKYVISIEMYIILNFVSFGDTNI